MIYTSSHNNFKNKDIETCSISGNKGKDANYIGNSFAPLAPKRGFWQIWHSNIGILSEEENNKYYIREYYKQVLSLLDPQMIYELLNGMVLLCYEDNMDFCHRHIVAAWLELTLKITVPEVIGNENGIIEVERPQYIKEYLVDVMKEYSKENSISL